MRLAYQTPLLRPRPRSPTPSLGSFVVKNVCPKLNDTIGSHRALGGTMLSVALGELIPTHFWNEFAATSKSWLSNPISSLLHPALYRSHGRMLPSTETNGVTVFSVMLFAVTFSNGPYTFGFVDL